MPESSQRDIRLIDCYSRKPADDAIILKAAEDTGIILVVEDCSASDEIEAG